MLAVGVDVETTDGAATGRKPAIAPGVVLAHARAVACERKEPVYGSPEQHASARQRGAC